MWSSVLLIAVICVANMSGRTIGPLEGPLWSEALAEALGDPDGPNNLEDIDERFRGSYEGKRRTEDSLVADHLDDELKAFTAILPSQKRALSMFARWGTINSLGKGRTPIRSKVFLDPVSASEKIVTRGRILGQPLRWG